MYEEYFGFSGQPFKLNPDPKFFFGSESHNKAMAYLHYGLRQGEGFIVITGEIGAGKSMLIGHLLDQVDRTNIVAADLVTPNLQPNDLLAHILSAFRIEPAGEGATAEIEAFEDFLFDQMNRGRRVLLIVDEAQNLPIETLEELRVLSNLDYDGTPLFQVFLVGQPDFKPVIARDGMEQLRQRIIASYDLQPLSAAETRAYIEHRLSVVGWSGAPDITDEAFQLVHEATGGVPRKINKLCNRMLLYCSIEKRDAADAEAVRAVVADLASEDVTGAPMTLPAGADKAAAIAGAVEGATQGAVNGRAVNGLDDAGDETTEEVPPGGNPPPAGNLQEPSSTTAKGVRARAGSADGEGETMSEGENQHRDKGPGGAPQASDEASDDGRVGETSVVQNRATEAAASAVAPASATAPVSVLDRLRAKKKSDRKPAASTSAGPTPKAATIGEVADAIAAARAPVDDPLEDDPFRMDDDAPPKETAPKDPLFPEPTILAGERADDEAGGENGDGDEGVLDEEFGDREFGDIDLDESALSGASAETGAAAWSGALSRTVSAAREDLKEAHVNVSRLKSRLREIETRRRDSDGRITASLDRAETLLAELREAWR